MKRWLAAVVLGLGVAALGASARAVAIRSAPRTMTAMVSDVRVELVAPLAGAQTEVRWVRVRGRVTATGAPATTARVEMGLLSLGQCLSSRTITARVGEEFSEFLEMPGDRPYTFYVGVVRLVNVVRSNDVRLRPMAGRDLSVGSRRSLLVHLTDDRGRSVEGRVVARQGGVIIGEAHTAGGRVQLYDMTPGEYVISATALGGALAGSLTARVTSSTGTVCIVPMRAD